MFSAGLSIHVIDPLNRTGKVAIPAHLVSDTKGLDDYRTAVERQEVKDFSLCLLFQKGRCNAGSRCHQIHASPEFVAELREKAASVKCCCAEHGDMHSHGYVHAPQIIRVVDAASTTSYHMSAFARTACLDTLLRSVRASNTEVIVPANKICRLHAQRRCKFGKDCKNVHLCPDASPIQKKVCPAAPALAPSRKACPSTVDFNCGISNRSVSECSSKPASLSESPNMTPRLRGDDAPLPRTLSSTMARSCPLSIDCDDTLERRVVGFETNVSKKKHERSVEASSFLFSDESVWGGVTLDVEGSLLLSSSASAGSALDMSAFEETMRTLCDDLGERTEFSPAFAVRVQSLIAF